MATDPSLGAFTEALGSSAPTPGGGAATALVASLATALVEMVARFTVGRPRYREVETRAQEIAGEAADLRVASLALVADDERAFEVVSSAYRLPKSTPDTSRAREEAIQSATRAAAEPPLQALTMAQRIGTLAAEIARIGNASVVSDAACAITLAEAAARAAALNVLANVAIISDAETSQSLLDRARAPLPALVKLRDETLALTYQRMGVPGL